MIFFTSDAGISIETHHPLFTVTGSCIELLSGSDSGSIKNGMTEPEPIHISAYRTVPQDVLRRDFIWSSCCSYWPVRDDKLSPPCVIHAYFFIVNILKVEEIIGIRHLLIHKHWKYERFECVALKPNLFMKGKRYLSHSFISWQLLSKTSCMFHVPVFAILCYYVIAASL